MGQPRTVSGLRAKLVPREQKSANSEPLHLEVHPDSDTFQAVPESHLVGRLVAVGVGLCRSLYC